MSFKKTLLCSNVGFKKKVIIITRGLRVFQRKKLAYFQNDAIKIPKGLKKLDTHTNIVRKNKGHK